MSSRYQAPPLPSNTAPDVRLPSLKELNFKHFGPASQQGSPSASSNGSAPVEHAQAGQDYPNRTSWGRPSAHNPGGSAMSAPRHQQHTPPSSAGPEPSRAPKAPEYASRHDSGGYVTQGAPQAGQLQPDAGSVSMGPPGYRGEERSHSQSNSKRARNASNSNSAASRDSRHPHAGYPPQYTAYPPHSQPPPPGPQYQQIPPGPSQEAVHQHPNSGPPPPPGYGGYQQPHYAQQRPPHPSQQAPPPPAEQRQPYYNAHPSAPPPQDPWAHQRQQPPPPPQHHTQAAPPPHPHSQHAPPPHHHGAPVHQAPPPHQQVPPPPAGHHSRTPQQQPPPHHQAHPPHHQAPPPPPHHHQPPHHGTPQHQPPHTQQPPPPLHQAPPHHQPPPQHYQPATPQQPPQPPPPQVYQRTTPLVPTTVENRRNTFEPSDPETVHQRESTMTEVHKHCTALYEFASRYLQMQGKQPDVQPSPEELAEMRDRASHVVKLLEDLRRLNVSPNKRQKEAAPLPAPEEQRPPKRPWEDMSQDDGNDQDGDGGSEAGDKAHTSTEQAEADMETIRTKRATSAASGAAAQGPPKSKYRKRSRATPPGKCHSCNIRETPEWRRGPDGARTLCNACGLHYAKLMRKRDKNIGPDGQPPRIDMETLRASARAADITASDKASRRAQQSSRSDNDQSSPSQDTKHAPNTAPHHEGSFQVMNMNMGTAHHESPPARSENSRPLQPQQLVQQANDQQLPVPPPPWAQDSNSGSRAYAPQQLQHQSFTRNSHSSTHTSPR